MPDPSPALIDIIAAAMWEADDEPGSWDRYLDYAQTSLVGLEEVEAWRARARAALAAMPKPIGYVGAWHEGDGWTLDIEYGERLRPTAAQALKDCSDYNRPIDTVVAVVPVEGNPA